MSSKIRRGPLVKQRGHICTVVDPLVGVNLASNVYSRIGPFHTLIWIHTKI